MADEIDITVPLDAAARAFWEANSTVLYGHDEPWDEIPAFAQFTVKEHLVDAVNAAVAAYVAEEDLRTMMENIEDEFKND